MAEYDAYAGVYRNWVHARSTTNPYTAIETHTFFEVLGALRGRTVLDLATGTGRTARMLVERGARLVIGTDVSSEMIRLAGEGGTDARLRFEVVDARDDSFRLAEPADLVTAMYLLVYAPNAVDLGRMARLIARNLVPGGRFVTYTLHPDFDLTQPEPRLLEQFGFDIQPTDTGRADLVIGELRVGLYQWSRAEHEARLEAAGLTDVRWHPLDLPPGDPELARSLSWYLERPHCVVVSAVKP